jgi:hypothetical protein
LCIVPVLEADDVVVDEAHDDHITARVPPAPLVGPDVEDIVEIDVEEQRRCRCSLRRSLQPLLPVGAAGAGAA